MIDPVILKKMGSTRERLKEIFTAVPDTDNLRPKGGENKEDKEIRVGKIRQRMKDIDTRARVEAMLQSRLQEHISFALNNYSMFAAMDLVWDTPIISKMQLPYLQYAQGVINLQRVVNALKPLPECEKYLKKEKDGKVIGVDLPKFVQSNINLVRSTIGRRMASQTDKYNNLWPFYRYEPRSTGLVGKCRADVLSQRVDIMADQFGYRNHDAQCLRDAFMYATCVDFLRCGWEVERQQRCEKPGDPETAKEIVVKEGVQWTNPHPSRVFWDNNHPLSSINSDTGCEHLGYWDICRFTDVIDDPAYYNREAIGWSSTYWGNGGLFASYTPYFDQYAYTMTPPVSLGVDHASLNDRKSNVGLYSGSQRDASMLRTHFYWKTTPLGIGCGDYPFPVWLHMVVASDRTVIFAEWMPSRPAAYLGINVNDSRQVNVSIGHEILSYQDQMNNLLNYMLTSIQHELIKIFFINTDVITKEEDKVWLEKQLKGQNYSCDPLVIMASLSKLSDMNIDVKAAIVIAETRIGQIVSDVVVAMSKLMELFERMMALSPNEQGQPAPREISATETTEISNTTATVGSSISDAMDEFRAAKKQIIYESLAMCSQAEIRVPVKERYSKKVIEAAGLTVGQEGGDVGNKSAPTITGSAKNLIHDYYFTTRDGAERSVNTQSANTLVQLLAILQNPIVMKAMGKEKFFNIINEIFRMSGSGFDLVLELKEGEPDEFGGDEMQQIKQTLQELQGFLQQMAGATKQNAEELAEQKQVNEDQEAALTEVNRLAGQVKELFGKHEEMDKFRGEIQRRLTESINYKDAPPTIQRQMEMQAGFKPALDSEREIKHNGD